MRYTVKQVSQLTGVSTDLLRAWERRYGIVSPGRTASRYRLYDDGDVARLRRMTELIADGAPASLAASQVLTENPTGDRLETSSWVPQEVPIAALPPVEALAEAGRELDRALLERTLDAGFAAGSFETVFEEWLTPALVCVGEAWERGDISVAGEHFVSAAVSRRLSQAFEAAGTPVVNAPIVAVGLPPRTMHELAALAFATCLRRRGVDVRYLGADLPVESWVSAVSRLAPAAVAFSVPRPADAPAARELVQALALADPSLPIFVGGHGCADWSAEEPVTLMPGSVTRSAHDLALSLAS